ncbi:hypothetical protein ABZW32_29630 [Streptomyces sp. NPDC004667]|uniref:hypothetical protein n=1 Tax=Streptomyces sp. NPDC004667 TaxID=3154285 RepID=UPI0033AFBA59
MNSHRTSGHPGVRVRRPAALASGVTAALALALTGLSAPAFAATPPVVAADPPHQFMDGDCGGQDDRSSGRCDHSRGGISYELQSRTLKTTFLVHEGATQNVSLACDPGWLIDSGGVALSTPPPTLVVQKSIKGVSESWEVTVVNTDTRLPHEYDVAIVCSRLVAIQH